MPYGNSISQIKRSVHICLGILKKNDDYLLQVDASERSIAHKLAEYLQNQFPDWNVDCEYNKIKNLTKRLEGIAACDGRQTDRIYPDIIVHLRGRDINLLVIEIKKDIEYDACDTQKLKLMTSRNGEYRYVLGLFLGINRRYVTMQWFIDGEEKEPKTFEL